MPLAFIPPVVPVVQELKYNITWLFLLQVVDAVLYAESGTQLVFLSGDMVSGFRNKYSIQGWFEQKYDLRVPEVFNQI